MFYAKRVKDGAVVALITAESTRRPLIASGLWTEITADEYAALKAQLDAEQGATVDDRLDDIEAALMELAAIVGGNND